MAPEHGTDMTTYAWTVCDDGKLYKTDGATVLTTVDIKAAEPWLTATNLLMVAPGPTGCMVVLDGNGIEKQRRWVFERIAWAIGGAEGRVYCFDGRGTGRVMNVTTAGWITCGERFNAPAVVDPLNAIISGSNLYIACANRDYLATFDLTDPDVPAFTAATRYEDDTLTGVVDATTVTRLDNNAAALGGDVTRPLFGGIVVGASKYYLTDGAIVSVP